MKVIVIGSKGFIGQHVFSYFKNKGHDVWGADVVVDYVHSERYFLIDATSADFNIVFHNIRFDLCINCSGAASVPDSLKNPVRDFYLNTVNVFKMLQAIQNFQPACKFINMSSAAVYGNPGQLPVKEDTALNPLSPYGRHKMQAEEICKEFYDFYGTKTCSLRIFSAYGAGLQKQLFWDLFRKAQSGEPFSLYGTGNESRDFIHILDLVKAIELVAEHGPFRADVINIANGEEILIKDAVRTFFSLFPHEVRYSFSGEIRKGDPVNWMADISILKSFGYMAGYDMKAGLRQYYNWVSAIADFQ